MPSWFGCNDWFDGEALLVWGVQWIKSAPRNLRDSEKPHPFSDGYAPGGVELIDFKQWCLESTLAKSLRRNEMTWEIMGELLLEVQENSNKIDVAISLLGASDFSTEELFRGAEGTFGTLADVEGVEPIIIS